MFAVERFGERQNGIRSPGDQKGTDHDGHHHCRSFLGRFALETQLLLMQTATSLQTASPIDFSLDLSDFA